MEDYHRYIYFQTLDHTGTPTTSGYTLPITPFTFIPIFDDGTSVDYSKKRILWDFGDGTTSEAITAVHSYKFPGWYNVKCYVLGKLGEGYVDSFSQNLNVHNFIVDGLSLSGFIGKTESGTKQNPFRVFRFNSWQTYNALSAEGYTIKLNVDGNVAPLLNVETYNKDAWGHLKPSSRFESIEFNIISQQYEKQPVNTVKTSSDEIYARIFNNKLSICDKTDTGACFAGTSGSKEFYFIDDIPKDLEDITKEQPITVYASLDITKFKDYDSNRLEYPENYISVLNNIFDTTAFSVMIEQLNSDHVTITSNGIDDDNNGNLITSFNIYPQKFVNQKIPFVVKIKDVAELTSKYNPVLQLKDDPNITKGEIYLELRDKNDNTINDVEFKSNMGVLSSEKYGGYFKGYLIAKTPMKNVHIFAQTVPVATARYLVDTACAIISEPQSDKIHSIIVKQDVKDKTRKIMSDNLINTYGLTGIYSSCVVSKRLPNGKTTYEAFLVDADREKIMKYDPINLELLYDAYVLPENSSPSDICSDSKGNIWVTLYDSISTVRINNASNLVDRIICPSVQNTVTDYENSVTPASLDTDLNDNLWISYANEHLSFIEKYDISSNFLFKTELTPNYESTEIITDLSANAWGIAKELDSPSIVLSANNDKIYKIDKDGTSVRYYDVSGSLWNITLDVSGNIWATKNVNEIVYVNTKTDTFSTFSLNTGPVDPANYISNLEGIACTTDNNILVVDNTNRKLHYFSANVEKYGFYLYSISLYTINDLPSNPIQDKINAYGDWNGFKYINKYQNTFGNPKPVYGNSNDFTLYPSTEGEYEIRKVNENFDMKGQIKSYRFQDYLLDNSMMFNDFIGTAVGTLSSKSNEIGKVVYEKISNFTNNIHNIDVCGIQALKSMYEMLDESFYTFSNTSYNLPAELNRLVDIFSINFSKLKGSYDKFDLNFNNKGYNNDYLRQNNQPVNYGINKGEELNFSTSVLTAGKNIIAYEKFSETYRVLNTNILSSVSAHIDYIDNNAKTYQLSTYHPNWGWGLLLPEEYSNDQIPLYYNFYNYVTGYTDIQNEGVINWSDPYNTIPKDISSIQEWDVIKQKMICYTLAKGLGIIKY